MKDVMNLWVFIMLMWLCCGVCPTKHEDYSKPRCDCRCDCGAPKELR